MDRNATVSDMILMTVVFAMLMLPLLVYIVSGVN